MPQTPNREQRYPLEQWLNSSGLCLTTGFSRLPGIGGLHRPEGAPTGFSGNLSKSTGFD